MSRTFWAFVGLVFLAVLLFGGAPQTGAHRRRAGAPRAAEGEDLPARLRGRWCL